MKQISSAQNPTFRNAMRLKSSRGRKSQRRIVIYGLRELSIAIASQVRIVELFFCPDIIDHLALRNLETEIEHSQTSSPASWLQVPEKLLNELAYGDRVDGIVAVAERPQKSLADLTADNGLFVVLQSIEKPGNIGAVLRSMDGAGASGLVIADPVSDPYHPNSIRASMGSVFATPVTTADSAQVLQWSRQHKIQLLAATDSADHRYTDADWTQPTAIILGNESSGLSDFWLQEPTVQNISIPMLGVCDSLNVSVAASVLLYQANHARRPAV